MHRRYAHRRHSHVPRLTRDLHERHRRAAATFSTAKSTKNQYQKNKEASATEVGGQLLPRLALFLYPFIPGPCAACQRAAIAVFLLHPVSHFVDSFRLRDRRLRSHQRERRRMHRNQLFPPTTAAHAAARRSTKARTRAPPRRRWASAAITPKVPALHSAAAPFHIWFSFFCGAQSPPHPPPPPPLLLPPV